MTNGFLRSFKTNDVFLHVPESSANHVRDAASERPLSIVFFIPGNPGLISYYHTFLELVAQSRPNLAIAGFSLGHFETDSPATQTESVRSSLLFPPSHPKKPPGQSYTLGDQIQLSYARLKWLIYQFHAQTHSVLPRRKLNVILAGHSVGAYIAIELVRFHHKSTHSNFALPHENGHDFLSCRVPFTTTATLLLTPTIENISRSQSGAVATPVLAWFPFFPALIQTGASALTSMLPTSWLRTIVRRVTGMNSDHDVDTTVSFLQTPGAVKQALFMARHEMLEINESVWTDEVWGVAGPAMEDKSSGRPTSSPEAVQPLDGTRTSWTAPKHFFLFAKQDHWIADATRNAIVEAHGGRGRIVVDSDGNMGLVHAWCLDKNNIVAEIVNKWLDEILL